MASRGRKPFYVYKLTDKDGSLLYIGKGSGRRLHNQCRLRSCEGEVVRRFSSERAAYQYERRLIAEMMPPQNRNGGGGGPLTRKVKSRRFDWEIEMERVGTRVYAARALLKFAINWEPGQRERIEAVANGAPV